MIILTLSAILLGFFLKDFFFQISYLGVDFNHLCLAAAPISEFRDYYQSLICGRKLQGSDFKSSLQNLGLIHLFVVSGAHLHFLDRLLKPLLFILRLQALRLPLLFVFVLTTAFPMAGFRAWLFLVIGQINDQCKLHLSATDRLLFSVVFCLALFPNQLHSIGLPLSWMACLGLIIGRNSFTQSAFIYFMTLPLMLNIQWLSPWSIAINAFFAPWIGSLLFPISVLTVCCPWFQPLGDALWGCFQVFAETLAPFVQTPSQSPLQWSNLWVWFFCLMMHFTSHLILRRKKHEGLSLFSFRSA